MTSPAIVLGGMLNGRRSRRRKFTSPMGIASLIISAGLVLALAATGHKWILVVGSEPPTIEAPEISLSVRPDNPGGQITEFTGYSVNQIISGRKANPVGDTIRLAAPPMELAPEDISPRDSRLGRSGIDATLFAREGLHREPGLALELGGDDQKVELAILSSVLATASSNVDTIERESDVFPNSDHFSGSHVAHIGDFPTRQQAETGWLHLLGSYGSNLRFRSVFVQELRASGAAVFRLRVSGFKNRGEVNDFCEWLQAGGDTCLPAVAE